MRVIVDYRLLLGAKPLDTKMQYSKLREVIYNCPHPAYQIHIFL